MTNRLPDYHLLTDDELQALVGDRENLTEEAKQVLEAELKARNIHSADIARYKAETEKFRKADELDVGSLNTFRGTGRKFYGKVNYKRDPISNDAEYDTTLWFALGYFPVFPIGSYRVREDNSGHWLWRFLRSTTPSVIQRNPLDWNQIVFTWIKAILTVLGLLALIPLLATLPPRHR